MNGYWGNKIDMHIRAIYYIYIEQKKFKTDFRAKQYIDRVMDNLGFSKYRFLFPSNYKRIFIKSVVQACLFRLK